MHDSTHWSTRTEDRSSEVADERTSLLIELDDVPGALESVLHQFSSRGVNLTHIESRPAKGSTFDFFVDCEGSPDRPELGAIIDHLRQHTVRLMVLDDREVPWFPRHGTDLDVIANSTLEAGTDLEADHPGFQDPRYRQQRRRIDELARSYRHGDALPTVTYSDEEKATWKLIYERLAELHPRHGCREYLEIRDTLHRACGFGADDIPQLRVVSDFLRARTGFRLRPVAGLLSARHFLNGLAFRVFFSTQYIRHHSRPLYTPEPDICHELIGHAPMFADPAFADLSQEIGLASLGAADAEIEKLARCYWFSVEFGLLRERSEVKAYGAGLLSSFGELEYACRPGDHEGRTPLFEPWEPSVAAQRSYPITEYQPTYFVAESLAEAKDRMRRFCEGLPRPFYTRYNPISDSIWVDRAVRRPG